MFVFAVIELGKGLPQLSLDMASLREEVVEYQVVDRAELPEEARIDRFWAIMGKDARFRNLSKLMKALLCIPHSNASSERVFSMVRKIVTENRMRMDNSTLCSLQDRPTPTFPQGRCYRLQSIALSTTISIDLHVAVYMM